MKKETRQEFINRVKMNSVYLERFVIATFWCVVLASLLFNQSFWTFLAVGFLVQRSYHHNHVIKVLKERHNQMIDNVQEQFTFLKNGLMNQESRIENTMTGIKNVDGKLMLIESMLMKAKEQQESEQEKAGLN